MRQRTLALLAVTTLAIAGCSGERRAADTAATPQARGAERGAHATASPDWAAWDAGLAQARSERRYVMIDVYTDWCGWCQRMDAEVFARADVRDYLAQKFVSIKLDAESDAPLTHQGQALTARELARGFGVSGYPTTIFLDADGEHLANVPGYLPPERFLRLLRFLGDGHQARGVSFQDYEAQAERS